MKQLRLHIYIILGLFLATLIVGSFLDLQINQALFSKNNGFGLFIAAFGTLPGYCMIAVLGGGFFSLGLKKPYKIPVKVIFFVLSAVCLGLAVYYSGGEVFSINAFYNPKLEWLGYVICFPFCLASEFLGYWLISKSKREHIWIILVVLAVAAFITLVPGVTLLKSIFHRPRFRSIIATDYGVEFHNWWVRCGNYKQYMEVFNLPKEEFKSFPSGHTGAAAVLIIVAPFLPMLDEKYQKLQLPLIYGALAWTLLVAFTRMLVGAHFLSDISMGALLAVICMLVGNEILIHLKTLNPKPIEEEPAQQPEA